MVEMKQQQLKNNIMKTVRKNSKRFAEILNTISDWKIYSLRNDFKGEVKKMSLSNLNNDHGLSIRENENQITVSIHSNLWYELSKENVKIMLK